MKIYEIEPNLEEFKYYLPDSESPIISILHTFDGRPLCDTWHQYAFELFSGKNKKEKSRRIDFNISCFTLGLLLVSDELKGVIEDKLVNKVEFLPVTTSDGRRFFFVNVINVKKCIAADSWQDFNKMDIRRSYHFHSISEDDMIFRDSVYSVNYFLTEKFANILSKINIKGGQLNVVGEC
ncbi:TPA: hypothetical protein ROS34_004965 [Escherichia coli]|uniref:hypothetical protein n=1 Tax=Enterobacteriaceae TaxID=543 RepID=UPI000694C13A|nr:MULTISPECIES: hypothetical protein [Enterobacteriaceae]EEQ5340586.1 hypothetical protein [Escherichia coli]EET5618190.1 hypothetical protein [Escherichia coli]EET5680833.1 hypothetical protein [Escherichia coli]EET5689560.1 hypothetical protein [Escherichia coli]EET5814450.1 hypothetical protein [Escherichia coli]